MQKLASYDFNSTSKLYHNTKTKLNKTTSKKSTVILTNTISPTKKRILQLLFWLVETIIKIRKSQFFSKITFFLPMKIREESNF